MRGPRMFWKLFAAYSLLLAASVGLLGWVLIERIEKRMLADARQSLEVKAVFVGEIAKNSNLPLPQWRAQFRVLGESTRTRITLIAADGTVLADSDKDPDQMENHLHRPEVEQASADGIGASSRFSDTLHQSMMYVARRVENGPVRYVRVALPLDAVEREIRWLHRAVWTAGGATLILALVISLYIARRVCAPLGELADAALSMAKGSYGQHVTIAARRDEIGELAAAFNEMSHACASHIAQMSHDREQLTAILRNMVEGVLVIDADQRVSFLNDAAARFLHLSLESAPGRKLWELLRHRQLYKAVERILAADEPFACELERRGNEEIALALHGVRLPGAPLRGAVLVFHDVTHLRKLERVRQDFVANVSHELKTPLAAIQAVVETLLDGALQDADHNVQFLERIRENADRLTRLVQDLLTLGRIESGEETLELQPMELGKVVASCIARHEQRARSQQLTIECLPPEVPVTTLADDEALSEILDNLVDNAIKYTPTGGRILLQWSAKNSDAVLAVEDTGVGIPEKELPRVFERFYRVDRARSRALGGTGLGLSIVKHLVQALGGSVTATSQVGVGSTFTVRLPLYVEPTSHSCEVNADGLEIRHTSLE